MSEEIVEAYQARNPTRANSREIVKALSETHKLSVPKVRNILVKAGVYVALPKDKGVVDRADYDAIFQRFAGLNVPTGFGIERDTAMAPIAAEFGYGLWAMGDLYSTWQRSGSPIEADDMQAKEAAEAAKRDREFQREVDRKMVPARKEYEKRIREIEAQGPPNLGLFSAGPMTFILLVIVFAMLVSLFKSMVG